MGTIYLKIVFKFNTSVFEMIILKHTSWKEDFYRH